MRRFWKNQQGVSLFELIITIVIVGIALPSLISVFGLTTRNFLQNEVLMNCVGYADSRMEEILSFRDQNWDWYKTIYDFETKQKYKKWYLVTTSVNQISGWGDANLDAYEITVTATHSTLENGYTLTMRLCKYK